MVYKKAPQAGLTEEERELLREEDWGWDDLCDGSVRRSDEAEPSVSGRFSQYFGCLRLFGWCFRAFYFFLRLFNGVRVVFQYGWCLFFACRNGRWVTSVTDRNDGVTRHPEHSIVGAQHRKTLGGCRDGAGLHFW